MCNPEPLRELASNCVAILDAIREQTTPAGSNAMKVINDVPDALNVMSSTSDEDSEVCLTDTNLDSAIESMLGVIEPFRNLLLSVKDESKKLAKPNNRLASRVDVKRKELAMQCGKQFAHLKKSLRSVQKGLQPVSSAGKIAETERVPVLKLKPLSKCELSQKENGVDKSNRPTKSNNPASTWKDSKNADSKKTSKSWSVVHDDATDDELAGAEACDEVDLEGGKSNDTERIVNKVNDVTMSTRSTRADLEAQRQLHREQLLQKDDSEQVSAEEDEDYKDDDDDDDDDDEEEEVAEEEEDENSESSGDEYNPKGDLHAMKHEARTERMKNAGRYKSKAGKMPTV